MQTVCRNIIGYVFQGVAYCPNMACIGLTVQSVHPADWRVHPRPDSSLPYSRSRNAENVEDALNHLARELGVNRSDESSFNSTWFPKLLTDGSGIRCGHCGATFTVRDRR